MVYVKFQIIFCNVPIDLNMTTYNCSNNWNKLEIILCLTLKLKYSKNMFNSIIVVNMLKRVVKTLNDLKILFKY